MEEREREIGSVWILIQLCCENDGSQGTLSGGIAVALGMTMME